MHALVMALLVNLLANGDFEGGAHGIGCCSSVSNGWTDFHRIHEPSMASYQFHEPQYNNGSNDARQRSGKSMSWGKVYATIDGGIWQQVHLPSSSGTLTFSVWMASWSGNGKWGDNPQGAMEQLVGIDPTGGTDVWASTVVWSPVNSTDVDWQLVTVSTPAKSDTATVFIRSRNAFPMNNNTTVVDDASLTLETAPSAPPPSATLPHDARYFAETGFRIDDDAFYDYFQHRGGLRTFGYPVSRSFKLLGSQVQIFQRRIVQKQANGGVGLLNVLDPGFMPFNSFNGAAIPEFDPSLVAGAPAPGSSGVLDYVRRIAPDQWMGLPVNFGRTFAASVSASEANVPASLLPGIELELWGVPTSQPKADPNNANFVYQRFQRGVMHFDKGTGATQGLLLADYFKAILTVQNLPPDVATAAQGSRFLGQYAPGNAGSVARPADLPDTDMTGAFEKG